ncbi:MAG TPA: hypothetical protein VGK00_11455 [Anaerolineales bacterium]|jgi:hypothetical protein
MHTQLGLEPSPLQRAILDTVMYADIFDYPLTAEEIQRYLPDFPTTLESVKACLETGWLPRNLCYYALPGRESIFAVRERREGTSRRLWSEARSYGRLIAGLPFVRMLAVTGSLAMNNVEARADIDYLIVTRPGSLWLCRLLVLGIVRLASWRGVNLCPNYLLSQNVLAFSEHNLYSAHEFAQMVPLSGDQVYRQMWDLNPWVRDFLPNLDQVHPALLKPVETPLASWIKSVLEALLLTPPLAWLERWEMQRKIRKLTLENSGNPETGFSADLCKGHSNRHGWRTRTAFQTRLNSFTSGTEK